MRMLLGNGDGRVGRPSWQPWGASATTRMPEPGSWLALDFRAWRLISVGPLVSELWSAEQRLLVEERGSGFCPVRVVLRPLGVVEVDPVAARAGDRVVSGVPGVTVWVVFGDAHFPVCSVCGEPVPCRERFLDEVAAWEIGGIEGFEVAGVCPQCREVVSSRQRSLTFPDNVYIPGGPPLTFHLRSRCWSAAARYERVWVAADPMRRRTTLLCPGRVTNHNDGTYDCSEFGECRGPRAMHEGGYEVCRCADCHGRGKFGCMPKASAVRNAPLT